MQDRSVVAAAASFNSFSTIRWTHTFSAVQEIVISDGHRDITSDLHVQQLQPGQRVLVRTAQAQDGAVFQVGLSHHHKCSCPVWQWCSTSYLRRLTCQMWGQ